jgi:DNA-binding SARP family transcriptional activator/tetratricopeptide (TPR) repeat protein
MQDLGDPATAVRLHTQAIEALREQDDPRGLALAYIRRATAYRYLSQNRESSQDAQAALNALEPRFTTCLEYADALLTQGVALYNQGKPEQALDWYQRALPAYQLLKDESAIIKTYTNIGVLLKTLGRFREAELAYQNALPKNAATQSMVWQANLYNSIALLQHTTGQYPAALASFDQAIQFARASGSQRFEAYVLAGIGDLYLELDAAVEAREAYRQARAVAVQIKDTYLLFYLDLMEARLAIAGAGSDALLTARQLLDSAARQLPELGSRYQDHFYGCEAARLALAEGDYGAATTFASTAVEYFAGEGYLIETPAARVLALVAFALVGHIEAAGEQAACLQDLLPNPDFAKLLAVAAREYKTPLQTLTVNTAPGDTSVGLSNAMLAQAAGSLLQLVEQFEANIPGWRRSVRRHAEVVPFAPPRLHIRALGKVQVKVGEVTLSGADWQVQTARDLLFLLLLYPEGLNKEQIGELLWPDSSPAELKLRFKNTIYRLRHAAGKEVIVFEGDTIYKFNRGMDYEYDVEDFLKEIGLAQKAGVSPVAAHYRRAIKLYRGRYLPDVDLEWALIERERLQQYYVNALLAYAQLEFDNQVYHSAVTLAQQALAVDTCQEEAHRLLMRVYAAQRNPVLVIRQYEQCCKALLEELAAEPSTQTRALYLSLKG